MLEIFLRPKVHHPGSLCADLKTPSFVPGRAQIKREAGEFPDYILLQ